MNSTAGLVRGALPGFVDQGLGVVQADELAFRPGQRGQGDGVVTGTAADIEDMRAGRNPEQLVCAALVALHLALRRRGVEVIDEILRFAGFRDLPQSWVFAVWFAIWFIVFAFIALPFGRFGNGGSGQSPQGRTGPDGGIGAVDIDVLDAPIDIGAPGLAGEPVLGPRLGGREEQDIAVEFPMAALPEQADVVGRDIDQGGKPGRVQVCQRTAGTAQKRHNLGPLQGGVAPGRSVMTRDVEKRPQHVLLGGSVQVAPLVAGIGVERRQQGDFLAIGLERPP